MFIINDKDYYLLGLLQLFKMAHDSHWPLDCDVINEDMDFDIFYQLIDFLCDDITEEEWEEKKKELEKEGVDVSDDYYYDGNSVFLYNHPVLHDFLELCAEYGRRNNISWSNNPFIKDAKEAIEDAFNVPDYTFCGWIDDAPNQMNIKIEVSWESGFYHPNWLLYALYNIENYLYSQVANLKRELNKRSAA